MDNKEYIEHILAADRALRDLNEAIMYQLSQKDVAYQIEFQDGTFYDFSEPLTREEYELFKVQRTEVLRRIMLDAVQRLVERPEATLNDIWGTVASLQVFKAKSERTDVISGESEDIKITETSKPLNTDSRYVKAQKSDITYEDYVELMSIDKTKETK